MLHTLITRRFTQALGRAMDWLGVTRRENRIECACGRDHRAKRASNFSHAFTPAMLQEAQKQAGPLMAQLGYDIEQSQLKAVPEFGLPALSFPSRRRQETKELWQRPYDLEDSAEYELHHFDTTQVAFVATSKSCQAPSRLFTCLCGVLMRACRHEQLFRDDSGFVGFAGGPSELDWRGGD